MAEHRETLTVSQAAEVLGVHRLTVYEAIANGSFPVPVVRVGRRILIPKQALERVLAGEGAPN